MRCPHFHFLCCLGFTLFCFSVRHISAEAPIRPKIVFNSTRDGNIEIYMMDTDGKQQVRLTQHPDADFQPVWSPTGEQILSKQTTHKSRRKCLSRLVRSSVCVAGIPQTTIGHYDMGRS